MADKGWSYILVVYCKKSGLLQNIAQDLRVEQMLVGAESSI
jgi:hypothetical protein